MNGIHTWLPQPLVGAAAHASWSTWACQQYRTWSADFTLTGHAYCGAPITVPAAVAPNLLRAAVSVAVAVNGCGPRAARSGDSIGAAVVLWGELAASGRRQWLATALLAEALAVFLVHAVLATWHAPVHRSVVWAGNRIVTCQSGAGPSGYRHGPHHQQLACFGASLPQVIPVSVDSAGN